MERIDASNWMEQWAARHGLELEPLRSLAPGEHYVGLVRWVRPGQLLPVDAISELSAMGEQLTFEGFGPATPAERDAWRPAAGVGGLGCAPAPTNRAGRVTSEPFRGLQVDEALFAAVDQFTLVGRGDAARESMQIAVAKFLGEGQEGLFGLNTYKHSWHFDGGASINWSEGREDWCLIIRGETLQLVGEARHVEFLLAVDPHATHCTRVDPRIDDYSRKLIDLGEVRAASEAGNFSGPRQCSIRTSSRLAKGQLRQEGATYYFGSRHGALVRFYDKGLESKGRICSNRCEVEYHKEKAAAAWVKLVATARAGVVEFTRACGELVCGAIDFVERGNHRHLDRMPRLTWWAAIVDRLGRLRLRVEKCVSTLNGALAGMVKQYGKKLARACVVGEAMGFELLLQLWHKVEDLRHGQELVDRSLSPLEFAFDPVGAFKPA